MCGILGCILGAGSPPLDARRVAAARDRMAHRGPDDLGVAVREHGRVLLAHRRLAVQDTSAAGQQPLRLAGRDLWITYNGEAYDFRAWRARLAGRGVSFRSRTDTEVVLALYAELGDDVVTILRGMYAFAIWDGERKRLLMARDRVGKKPLYYAETARGFAFASTLPALLELGLVEPRLREDLLPEYLALGHVAAPDTLLAGVRKLPPGHVLARDLDGPTRVASYHEWQFEERQGTGNDRDLADALRESVRLRLVSDVPVGVALSGGVDSSLVAALAAREAGEPLATFTVRFEQGGGVDEAQQARQIASHLGALHHEVPVSPADVADALPEIEEHIDEPHPNLVWVAMWFLCRLARERGVTVLLTGDGGDETFFGYSRWVALLRAYRRVLRHVEAMPGPARRIAAGVAGRLLRGEGAREVLRRVSGREPLYWGPTFFYPSAMSALLSGRGRDVLARHPPLTAARLDPRGAPLPRTPEDLMQWMRRRALQGHLVEDFLARLDRMGMAVSVEGRAPLLDHDVLGLACRWPVADLVRDGRGKAPLWRLARDLLPPALIERPKTGFCAPARDWLRGGLWDFARQALEGLADEIPFFDAAALARWSSGPPAGQRQAAQMWSLVSLARWWRRIGRSSVLSVGA